MHLVWIEPIVERSAEHLCRSRVEIAIGIGIGSRRIDSLNDDSPRVVGNLAYTDTGLVHEQTRGRAVRVGRTKAVSNDLPISGNIAFDNDRNRARLNSSMAEIRLVGAKRRIRFVSRLVVDCDNRTSVVVRVRVIHISVKTVVIGPNPIPNRHLTRRVVDRAILDCSCCVRDFSVGSVVADIRIIRVNPN